MRAALGGLGMMCLVGVAAAGCTATSGSGSSSSSSSSASSSSSSGVASSAAGTSTPSSGGGASSSGAASGGSSSVVRSSSQVSPPSSSSSLSSVGSTSRPGTSSSATSSGTSAPASTSSSAAGSSVMGSSSSAGGSSSSTGGSGSSGGPRGSIRFFGYGQEDADRIKIPVAGVNVGAGDFTVEFFILAAPGSNARAGGCAGTVSNEQWINGHIMVDRDVYGSGDYGDFGLSLWGGRATFGLAVGGNAVTLCAGGADLRDGAWHHLAAVRDGGQMKLFVDGQLALSDAAPAGDASYRVGRSTSWPNDPFLVLGAEKHDADPTNYPSFEGLMDEVRISTVARYQADFAVPTAPFVADANTLGLYHLDEGAGTVAADSAAPAEDGTVMFRTNGVGPAWAAQSPY